MCIYIYSTASIRLHIRAKNKTKINSSFPKASMSIFFCLLAQDNFNIDFGLWNLH